jgi:hypothetical protein
MYYNINDIVKNIGHIDYMKIDAEGQGLGICEGLTESKLVDQITIETCEKHRELVKKALGKDYKLMTEKMKELFFIRNDLVLSLEI